MSELEQSHGGAEMKTAGSFDTITLMTAQGNSLNHLFSKSGRGRESGRTALTYQEINPRRQPPVRGNYRSGSLHEEARLPNSPEHSHKPNGFNITDSFISLGSVANNFIYLFS